MLRRLVHGQFCQLYLLVPSNMCPRCHVKLSTPRQARLHLRRYFPLECQHRQRHEYYFVRPRSFVCHHCDVEFSSCGQLYRHCENELQQLAQRALAHDAQIASWIFCTMEISFFVVFTTISKGCFQRVDGIQTREGD